MSQTAPSADRPITAQDHYIRRAFVAKIADRTHLALHFEALMDNPVSGEVFSAVAQFFFEEGQAAAAAAFTKRIEAATAAAQDARADAEQARAALEQALATAAEATPTSNGQHADAAPAAATPGRRRPADPGPGTARLRILNFIRDSKRPQTSAEVKAFADREGISSHHSHLSQMFHSGHLARDGEGRYFDPHKNN